MTKQKDLLTKLLELTLALASLAVITSFTSCHSSGKKVITAETAGLPAPFIVTLDNEKDALYTTKDGVYLGGYDIAVLIEAFKTEYLKDYELDLRVTAFATALTDAQQGVIDFTVNNWSYNDSRVESYYFSYPYTKTKYEIISTKGTSYQSFEEVAASGKKVQSSAGNNVANAIERWNEVNPSKKIILEYVESNTTQDQLQKIIDGDYVGIGDLPVYASYKTEFPALFAQIEETILSTENSNAITQHATSHLLFGKTSANSLKYQELFSKAIYSLYESGKIKELSEKYIGYDIVPDKEDFYYINGNQNK
ncbi:transporter substrate-binding domain-containing protein [Treponema zioleckii]|uniref:transporter substrate-binding domain-containing protein n=1 Tax=Treponema zioleckii TaxID=331680 RepID=UPI00168A8D13|nr:transporter substrate-binding domain-containing protein [Treponema zioleckii]